MRFAPYRILTVVFLVALVTRTLVFLVALNIHPLHFLQPDSYGYLAIAKHLLLDGSFSMGAPDGSLIPDATRTPIYPLFLTLFFGAGAPVLGPIIIQIILGSITCVFVFLLAIHWFQSTAIASLAALLLALDIPSILINTVLLAETLFAFLLTSSLLLYLHFKPKYKTWPLLAHAFVVGLVVLTRPIALVYIPLFGYFWFKQEGLKSAVIAIAVSVAVLSCWTVRNQNTFGAPFLSNIAEVNLLYHTASKLKASQNHVSITSVQREYKDKTDAMDWRNPSTVIAFRSYAKKECWDQIVHQPIAFAKLYIKGLCFFFFKPARGMLASAIGTPSHYSPWTSSEMTLYTMVKESAAHVFRASPWLSGLIVYQVVTAMALFFFALYFLSTRSSQAGLLILTGLIILTAMASAFTEVDARFRASIMPLYCVIAAGGIQQFVLKYRKTS